MKAAETLQWEIDHRSFASVQERAVWSHQRDGHEDGWYQHCPMCATRGYLADRNRARRTAVALEQECADLTERATAACAVLDQFSCPYEDSDWPLCSSDGRRALLDRGACLPCDVWEALGGAA